MTLFFKKVFLFVLVSMMTFSVSSCANPRQSASNENTAQQTVEPVDPEMLIEESSIADKDACTKLKVLDSQFTNWTTFKSGLDEILATRYLSATDKSSMLPLLENLSVAITNYHPERDWPEDGVADMFEAVSKALVGCSDIGVKIDGN